MSVIARMDKVVDDFAKRCRWFREPITKGRARMFALQHRLNTRQRNSVLKLKVATNCPDWETRMRIIGACSGADIEHSKMGWRGVQKCAGELHMEDAVVAGCERNLHVGEHYLKGMATAGDHQQA